MRFVKNKIEEMGVADLQAQPSGEQEATAEIAPHLGTTSEPPGCQNLQELNFLECNGVVFA